MTAVQKAIASKRITALPDGTVDPERANQEWAKNTFAGQTINRTPAPTAPPKAVARAPLQEPTSSGDPVAAYLRARAIKESFAVRTAQLEYEERAGKLIQATKAGEYAAQFSAIVGDALSAMPDRLTPLIAATTSEEVIHKVLTTEINALRRKVAKAIVDAGF